MIGEWLRRGAQLADEYRLWIVVLGMAMYASTVWSYQTFVHDVWLAALPGMIGDVLLALVVAIRAWRLRCPGTGVVLVVIILVGALVVPLNPEPGSHVGVVVGLIQVGAAIFAVWRLDLIKGAFTRDDSEVKSEHPGDAEG